jgi:hypothetical protein
VLRLGKSIIDHTRKCLPMKRPLSSKKRSRSTSQDQTTVKDRPNKTYTGNFKSSIYGKEQKKSLANLSLFSINGQLQNKQLKNNFMDHGEKKTDDKSLNCYLTKKIFNNESNSKIVKAKRKRFGNTIATAIPVGKNHAKENLKRFFIRGCLG